MYLGRTVEEGPANSLFNHPAHPYTQTLISAIPQHDSQSLSSRIRLTGDPRSPIDPDPNVCRFYGRCHKGQDHCASEYPKLQRIEDDHFAGCHFPNSVQPSIKIAETAT